MSVIVSRDGLEDNGGIAKAKVQKEVEEVWDGAAAQLRLDGGCFIVCGCGWLVVVADGISDVFYVFVNLDSFGEATKSKNSKIDVKKNGIWQHFDFLGEIRISQGS